jgi:hypothetical protein
MLACGWFLQLPLLFGSARATKYDPSYRQLYGCRKNEEKGFQ